MRDSGWEMEKGDAGLSPVMARKKGGGLDCSAVLRQFQPGQWQLSSQGLPLKESLCVIGTGLY